MSSLGVEQLQCHYPECRNWKGAQPSDEKIAVLSGAASRIIV